MKSVFQYGKQSLKALRFLPLWALFILSLASCFPKEFQFTYQLARLVKVDTVYREGVGDMLELTYRVNRIDYYTWQPIDQPYPIIMKFPILK